MDQFSDAIAVLGVYFALMAVLAVCVEAILGFFKLRLSALQGNPSPETVLKEAGFWLTEDEKRQTEVRVGALNRVLATLGQAKISGEISGVELAEKLGEATKTYIQKERDRRSLIRILAILLGFGLAAIFQIDTVELLSPLVQSNSGMWHAALTVQETHLLGLVLSGIAASAGSSYWHDKSAQLRQIKNAQQAMRNLREA